jgi:hypothetical protein
MPAGGGRVQRRADTVRDKTMDLIQMLLDHEAAGAELVVRSKGETGNPRLGERFPRANTLRLTRTASSAGRSAGDRCGRAASLTRPGRELNDGTSTQLAEAGLTR